MSLKSAISELLSNLRPPTRTRVIVRGHQQPPSSAHQIDVDVLHGYLRSAEAGDTRQLFGLYRDILASHAHTQAVFGTRKLAVLGDPLNLIPEDPDNAEETALALAVQKHLTDRPGWMQFISHLLDSTLYPVAVSERCYRVSTLPGWRYELGAILPVPHTHLAWPMGDFRIRETDDEGNFLGTYYAPVPRTHIVHSGHLLCSVPHYWGGPMRALLFWWLFATMDRDWWARFLDRFGSPFLVGKYEEEDERARYELTDAFSAATRLFGLAVSKDTDIEMHQANSQGGGDAFEKFHTVANDEISKLVLGQTSSSSVKDGGLGGGGQAAAQSEVREDIRRYDAAALSHTIRTQILAPLWQVNGWTTPIPSVVFGAIDAEEADLTGDLIASLHSAGIELADDGLEKLSQKLGLSLRRIPALPLSIALSGRQSLPLLAPAARRAARQRQARSAVDSLVLSASPKLARMLSARANEFATAIANSDSPEAAAAAVAALAASYDPSTASDLIAHVLASASANAVLVVD